MKGLCSEQLATSVSATGRTRFGASDEDETEESEPSGSFADRV